MVSRTNRTLAAAGIGFGVVMVPGMFLAAFAIGYAFAAALVGALAGALIGYFGQ